VLYSHKNTHKKGGDKTAWKSSEMLNNIFCTGVEITDWIMTFLTWKDRFSSADKIGHFETYKIKKMRQEDKWRDQIGYNLKLNKITNSINYYGSMNI